MLTQSITPNQIRRHRSPTDRGPGSSVRSARSFGSRNAPASSRALKEAEGFVMLPGGFGTLGRGGRRACSTLVARKDRFNPIVLLDVPGGQTGLHRWLEFIGADSRDASRHFARRPRPVQDHRRPRTVALEELTSFYTNYHRSGTST